MQVELQSIKGGSAGKVDLSDTAFGCEFNEGLIHQIVTAYLADARSGTKAQKSRAEVRGGGEKPWRQKGTGRARAGSIRSPIWRGGGKTFAAKPRDYGQKVNKKQYRAAMRSILSELLRQGRLVVVDEFTVASHRTKELVGLLQGLGTQDALIVAEDPDEKLFLAARNLPKVAVCEADRLDPVSLVGFEKVIITRDAAKRAEEWLG